MAFCESCKQRVQRTRRKKKLSATVVSKCDVFTLGIVETQIGWCYKFC